MVSPADPEPDPDPDPDGAPDGDEAQLAHLSRAECLALLTTRGVGRLAVAVPASSPLVVPVNFVLDGEVVVFRSGMGTKLRALRHQPVSFQVDDIDPVERTGWSVLVQGIAYEATPGEVAHLFVTPWVPGDKEHWVRILPASITGRRIDLPQLPVDTRGYL